MAEAKPSKDIIYLEADDEITAIIDKVENAKQKIVALVLPKRSTALQSTVNMRLLARNADNAEKDVVLITSDTALLPLAGAAGLHVAKNLQSKPEVPPSPVLGATAAAEPADDEDIDSALANGKAKLDYHRSVGELASGSEAEEAEAIDIGDEEDEKTDTESPDKKAKTDEAPKDKKLKVPNFDKFRWLMFGGIGLFLLLVFLIIFGFFVWPKATVTLQTTSLPVSTNFNLTTSDSAKTLDEDKGVIPALLKTQDQTSSQSVTATGQKNLGNKASGSVSMSACETGFSAPSSVPDGTGITDNGHTYITQEATSFSNAGTPTGTCISYPATKNTSISAQSPGAAYNTSNSATFSVNGRSDVSASGSAGNGSDNNVTVVSQSDVDNVKNKVTTGSSSDSTGQAFLKKTESDTSLYVVESTLKAGDPIVTASPDVGQQASNTTVTIKVTYSVLTVKKADLTKIISDKLNKQVDKTKQRLSSSDVVKDAQIAVQSQSSPTVAILQINENTTAVPIIDVAGVQKQVVGLKKGDIESQLQNIPGVKNVEVSFSPFWVSKAPKSAGKIHIIQQQLKD